MTLRVGWFSTGRGDGSRRLLKAAADAIGAGDLDAEIAFLFCNRERGEYEATDGFLDLAESHGIPTITLSSRQFRRDRGGALSEPNEPLPPWRAEYDEEVAKLLSISERHVWALDSSGRIPTPIRLGRSVRWNVDELCAWQDAGCPARDEWERIKSARGAA